MIKKYKLHYESPIGIVEIEGSSDAISSIMFVEENEKMNLIQVDTPPVLVECYNQLEEYFKGSRFDFTFPYEFEGTEFQKTVWQALTKIPYGETVAYQHIARLIENEKAVRAVGSANGKNKLSIVIPCHRIIGSNGNLTGYAGGLWRKEWLLNHEREFKKVRA